MRTHMANNKHTVRERWRPAAVASASETATRPHYAPLFPYHLVLFAHLAVPDVVAQQQRSEEQWTVRQMGVGLTKLENGTQREKERGSLWHEGNRKKEEKQCTPQTRAQTSTLPSCQCVPHGLASPPWFRIRRFPTPVAWPPLPFQCLNAVHSRFLRALKRMLRSPMPRNDSVIPCYALSALCVRVCVCVFLLLFRIHLLGYAIKTFACMRLSVRTLACARSSSSWSLPRTTAHLLTARLLFFFVFVDFRSVLTG